MPELDPSQQRVIALDPTTSAVVVGAPGSGKTRTLIELAADRVETHGLDPDELLVLAASRGSATRLRDRLAERLRRVSTGPLARTAASVAFEAVTAEAFAAGAPAPRLLSGAEQDVIIRELLEPGSAEERELAGLDWPDHLGPPVRALKVFRTELRELLARATEHGLTPAGLRELGIRHGRPEWVAAAGFLRDYRAVLAATRTESLDAAELLSFAERAVGAGEVGERLERVGLLLVDDLQQATEGTLRLITAFAARGAVVVAFGDPDIAANTFRGGESDAVASLGERLSAMPGGSAAPLLVLDRVHRSGPELRSTVAGITGRIGAAGVGRQRAAPSARDAESDAPPAVLSLVESSPAAQHTAIARRLRERHLENGVPWREQAVIVRSGALIPAIARALALAQVPSRTVVGGRALRDDVAAGALLRLVELGVGRIALDRVTAAEILLGPFGGLDAVALRRLRVALRAEELAGGGARLGDELVADALLDPARLVTIDHAVARRASRMARLLARLRDDAAAGASVEELLWSAWEASGVAEPWRARALGTGIAADEADRALDGVVALFTAARRWVERRPEDPPESFLADVLDAEVPEDTLAPQSAEDAVLVTTASGAVGTEFDTVVVAGLQEGGWPNLRIRGSLLATSQLDHVLAGRDPGAIDERRAVLADELRTLALAASRARSQLLVAAVASDDDVPSPFFGLLAEGAQTVEPGAGALTLRGLTARLRRTLTRPELRSGPGGVDRAAAAAALAALAREGVGGAAPSDWHGLEPESTDAPLYDLDDPEVRVPVSPSQLANVERSPLEWFVDAMGGSAQSTAAGMGTLVHDVLEHAVETDADSLWAALQERWGELVFEAPWLAEKESRAARRAIDALAEYLRDFAADGAVLVSAEGAFLLDLAPATLSGKIDRVEARDGRVVIVDLKTGRVESAKDAAEHPQLGAYQLAYADGALDGLPEGHAAGGARLLFTKEGTSTTRYTVRAQEPFTTEQLEGFRARIREAAHAMAGARFRAVPSDDPYAKGGDIRRVHLPGEVTGD